MTDNIDIRAAGARRLKDKVCIVTGSVQGIGKATVLRMAQEGGKIVVSDRIDESASKTTNELKAHGTDVILSLIHI